MIAGPWVYKGAALPSGSKINLAGNTDLWVSRHSSTPEPPPYLVPPKETDLADLHSGGIS